MVEFVNPKYKAGSRTEFKKPTRLECMMQDFPKLMSKELGDSAKVRARGRRNRRDGVEGDTADVAVFRGAWVAAVA